MTDITQKENIMGTQKMSKLILFTEIPLMLSLFINLLYNFVDSMFVLQVSEKALTALSLTAPVQLLVSAVGILMNSILITFSSTAVAVYGICIRINGVSTVGIHGITNGLIPIVAYNWGCK